MGTSLAAIWLASVVIAFGVGVIAAAGMTIRRFEDFSLTVFGVAWGYVLANVGLAIVVAAVAFAWSVVR